MEIVLFLCRECNQANTVFSISAHRVCSYNKSRLSSVLSAAKVHRSLLSRVYKQASAAK